MNVTFNFSALHYLDQWIEEDKKWHNELNSSDRGVRLRALNDLTQNYGVIRNLHREFDIEATPPVPRLSPILDIIEKPEYQHITLNNRIEIIENVTDEIEKHYHTRVLSLVTKTLWAKHRDPIVIYDSKARKALEKYGYPPGYSNIDKYLASWETFYQSHQTEIDEACKSLHKARSYSKFANELTDQDIKDLAVQPWFQRRVFDIFLFYEAPGSLIFGPKSGFNPQHIALDRPSVHKTDRKIPSHSVSR